MMVVWRMSFITGVISGIASTASQEKLLWMLIVYEVN